MIANQVLQSTLEGLKMITRIDMCIVDTDGIMLASTFRPGDSYLSSLDGFQNSPAESQVVSGNQFFKVFDESQLAYVLIVSGDSDEAYMVGKMAAYQIQTLITAYKERFDKENFIKNLLLDNLLLVDIYNRAKKLHIAADARRVVFIIETKRDNSGLDSMKIAAQIRSSDCVTEVDEQSIVIVRELSGSDTENDLPRIADELLKGLPEENRIDAVIAYGSVVGDLKDVSRSYKEARMALNVGRIFFSENQVIAYSGLGIGRLIYQLPMPLCRMFIKEIFGKENPAPFEEETITTIEKFFENSLNVSETSRQLFIHRNTLVYRLDKLQNMTGLDLRVFEDAITLRIALMVVKYMNYMEKRDF